MKLDTPRIAPLADDAIDPDTHRALGTVGIQNIFRTLAHHPKLLKRWLVFGSHILSKSTLSPRDRELMILRTGWVCGSEYEWAQHAVIGRHAGLTDEEITRIAHGPDAEGWGDFDRVQLRAVDELRADSFISDATWGALAERYDTRQLMDVVFTVGQYTLVSMALNSFGVQLDEGLTGFPDVARSKPRSGEGQP